jgi:hypothetical protein
MRLENTRRSDKGIVLVNAPIDQSLHHQNLSRYAMPGVFYKASVGCDPAAGADRTNPGKFL